MPVPRARSRSLTPFRRWLPLSFLPRWTNGSRTAYPPGCHSMRFGKHGGVGEVTVYTQRFCGCCSEATRVLRRNGIPFVEVGTREGGGREGLRTRFGERSG